jgi:hypothetical protein
MSKITDPTDDKMYEGLSLTDFMRHFTPQEAALRKEVEEINEKGQKPYLDHNFPETKPTSRSGRRQQILAQRKADKKAKKLHDKTMSLMPNPKALKKAIEDPRIKYEAQKILAKLQRNQTI